MTMATQVFVLPGDRLDESLLPSHPKKPLRLGPGLQASANTVNPTVAGLVYTDRNKNAVWIEFNGSRYVPTVGDLVIATIQRSAGDIYYASLSDYTPSASLDQLSFEGASRKTKPNLNRGSLVYARVTLANKHMDPELECVSSSTGKSEGLGPLTGGMLFDISLGMARRLMLAKPAEQGALVLLDEIGAGGVAFEIAAGRNGKFWVDSKSVKGTLAIGRAVQDTDTKSLTVEEQKRLAKKTLRDF